MDCVILCTTITITTRVLSTGLVSSRDQYIEDETDGILVISLSLTVFIFSSSSGLFRSLRQISSLETLSCKKIQDEGFQFSALGSII